MLNGEESLPDELAGGNQEHRRGHLVAEKRLSDLTTNSSARFARPHVARARRVAPLGPGASCGADESVFRMDLTDRILLRRWRREVPVRPCCPVSMQDAGKHCNLCSVKAKVRVRRPRGP
jgi:hypothetical protein